MNIERKSLSLEVKEIDADQGIIRGYLSTFGNVDYQKDRVVPGAFRKTIQDALQRKTNKGKRYLWPLLWMHEAEKPIGGFIDAQEDKKGLLVTAQLDISTNEQGVPANPLATMVFSGFKAGYIDELSIGYKALQKDYDAEGIRNLKEVQVWEGSACTLLTAANPEAQVPADGVKSSSAKDKKMEAKDFNDRYRQECIDDWMYSDFQNLTCALKAACMDIFKIGDEPQSDVVNTILEDNNGTGFISALKAWVQKGIDLDVSNYLQDPNPNMYYMSRNNDMDIKASMTKATSEAVAGHVKALQDAMMQHKAMADLHYKMLDGIASDLGALLGTPENFDGDGKTRNLEPLNTLKSAEPDTKSTQTEELKQFEDFLKAKLTAK